MSCNTTVMLQAIGYSHMNTCRYPCIHSHVFRLEMAVLAGSPVTEGDALKTTTNTAYEKMKQRGQGGRLEDDYEYMSTSPGDPPPDNDEKYDMSPPYAPHQPLPPTPCPMAPPTYSNVGVAEEAEEVYESIPGDKCH